MTEVNTIRVSIAKLGTSIQEVVIPEGSNVMAALRKADYNLDAVVTIKRNWEVATLDTVLEDTNVLLVSMEKIKWGNEEAPVAANPLMLSFTVVKENQQEAGRIMYTDDMSKMDIIKQELHNRGVSLNDFKEVQDEEGNVVTTPAFENNKAYKIILCANRGCSDTPDCYEDEDY